MNSNAMAARRRAPVLLASLLMSALVALNGCGVFHPTIPIVAERPVDDLAGVWVGTYRSEDTGRSGDIYFELIAESDSAVGEVVMTYFEGGLSFYPREASPDRAVQGPHIESEVLTIRFVRVGDAEVSGTLDPYADPSCGCVLHTSFRGVIHEGVIEGTFIARNPGHEQDQEGTWRVVRRP